MDSVLQNFHRCAQALAGLMLAALAGCGQSTPDPNAAVLEELRQLRQAVAIDPHLQVLIVHGWNDLSCPFMGSILTVDQMPAMGDASRVQVKEYAGGHMFYARPDSQSELRADAMKLFGIR